LSQVYGFVHQSGGFLQIDSAPASGTRVRIHLPRAGTAGRHTERAEATEGPATATGTILVVEDDVDVRSLVVEQLVALGYRVVEAATGQAALDLIASEPGPIDLVLTDVIMPGGMSGMELAQTLRTSAPSLKVVLTSGFMSSGTPPTAAPGLRGEGRADYPILSKPYRQNDLARVIERTLAAPDTPR
jgi:CheY-like chemotaxis protein